jgi:hypothetical protein
LIVDGTGDMLGDATHSVLNQSPPSFRFPSINRSGYLQNSFIIIGTFFAGRLADVQKVSAGFLCQPEISANSRAESSGYYIAAWRFSGLDVISLEESKITSFLF